MYYSQQKHHRGHDYNTYTQPQYNENNNYYNNNYNNHYNDYNQHNQGQYNERNNNYCDNNYDNNDNNDNYNVDDNYDNYNEEQAYESFTHRNLTKLLENEIAANDYYGKTVSVYLLNQVNFKGKLSSISTDSTITFEPIAYDSVAYNYNKVVSYKHISDILLIENEQHKDYLKSIKNEILDLVKLKMVENILHNITEKQLFEAFDIKFRKQYLQSKTDLLTKQKIGENILAIEISNDYTQYPILTQELQHVFNSEFFMKQRTFVYDKYDAFSLLYDYHQIWCDHIQLMNPSLPVVDNTNKPTQKNYLDWDETEINTTLDTNGQWGRRIYDSDTKLQAKNVYIGTKWTYARDFTGPCFKSKQKNTDWRCMQCNGQSTNSYSELEDKIAFYKCRRTDVTIEICVRCAMPSMRNLKLGTCRYPRMSFGQQFRNIGRYIRPTHYNYNINLQAILNTRGMARQPIFYNHFILQQQTFAYQMDIQTDLMPYCCCGNVMRTLDFWAYLNVCAQCGKIPQFDCHNCGMYCCKKCMFGETESKEELNETNTDYIQPPEPIAQNTKMNYLNDRKNLFEKQTPKINIILYDGIDVFDKERKNEFFIEWRIKDKNIENKMEKLQQELLDIDPCLQILQSCASNNMHITMNQIRINNKRELDLAIDVIKQFEKNKCQTFSDIIKLNGFGDFNNKVLFINTIPMKHNNLFTDIFNELKNKFVAAGLIHKSGSLQTHLTVCKASKSKNSVIDNKVWKFIKEYERNNKILGEVELGQLVFCVKRKKNELTPPILYTIKFDTAKKDRKVDDGHIIEDVNAPNIIDLTNRPSLF